MATTRRYLLWGLMVLMSGWLLLVPFQAGAQALLMMTTDGCGQVVAPDRLQEIGTLMRAMRYILAVALIIEIVIPKASWSAWVLASFPIAGFLLATAAVSLFNAEFLRRCDLFVLSPAITAQLNILTVAALVLLGMKRLRQKGTAST